MKNEIYIKHQQKFVIDKKRLFHLFFGSGIFLLIYFLDFYPSIITPFGDEILLNRESKAAIGILFLASYWWIAEVMPVGITGIIIGLIQIAFLLRPTRDVFANYMDPSVWFIFASLTIGTAFSKTGLTRRIAYFILSKSGNHVYMIYFICFLMTLLLTLILAHTAVAAALFPLFLTVHSLFSEKTGTKFGKGLFIGMAFSAGAGSIITLFGSARGAVAIDLLEKFKNVNIDFLTYSQNLIIPGIISLIVIWAIISLLYSPKEKRIIGLENNVKFLLDRTGRMNRNEFLSIFVTLLLVFLLIGKSFLPMISTIHNSAIMLFGAIILYILNILSLDDLESTSWNIILLFGGSISLGAFLWESGAAKWLAYSWISITSINDPDLFVLSTIILTLLLTNLIMNVAAVSLILPIVLSISEYLNIPTNSILFVILSAAGMPFLLLSGAAPNAIAYQSGHFKTKEFLFTGLLVSVFITIIIYSSYKIIW